MHFQNSSMPVLPSGKGDGENVDVDHTACEHGDNSNSVEASVKNVPPTDMEDAKECSLPTSGALPHLNGGNDNDEFDFSPPTILEKLPKDRPSERRCVDFSLNSAVDVQVLEKRSTHTAGVNISKQASNELTEEDNVQKCDGSEWDTLPVIGGESTQIVKKRSLKTPIISIHEALEYFHSQNYEQVDIVRSVPRSKVAAFIQLLRGSRQLVAKLQQDFDFVLQVAVAEKFDDTKEIHVRLIQGIYKQLVGVALDCPRFGSHWQQIGFQGNDPATDLRATGCLSLLNLLYLVTEPTLLLLARQIHVLSQHETQNFPMCVMGINMTRICLQAMREGCLNKLFNKRGDVFPAFSEFYVATFLHMYLLWKRDNKTIIDSAFVLKDVEKKAKRKPNAILKQLKNFVETKPQKIKTNEEAARKVEFSELDDIA